MGALDLWLDDATALARRMPARSARAFLGARRLVVPTGCSALIEDPEPAVLPAGSQRDKLPDLTLVKDALFGIDVEGADLIDRDGHPHSASATLSLYVDTADIGAVRRFRGTFLADANGEAEVGASQVRARLAGIVQQALVGFVSRHGAETLHDPAVDEALELDLRRVLRGPLDEAGLALSRVRRASFRSEELEKLRAREAARLRAEAEEEQRRAELMAQAETVGLAKQLEAEAIERELARQRELDERRLALEREREDLQRQIAHDLQAKELDHRLALAKKAIDELGDADMAALVAQVGDDAARERLYSMLIQQQMTPDQLAALSAQRQAAEVEALRAQLEALTGKLDSSKPAEQGPPSARILVASGEAILAFDPTTNVDPTRPRERYVTGAPMEDLGGVRSVRLAPGGLVLAGARGGVHVIDPASETAEAYRINRPARSRTGVNSVALLGDTLLATHSEFGLLAWTLDEEASARDVAREATVGASAVRALVCDGQHVFFAADSRVYALDASLGAPRLYTGPVQPVSALVLIGDQLYASTVGGAIYAWHVGDPHSPRRIHARRAKIYSLRPLGTRALLIGSKDRGVLRLDLDSGSETTFQATSLVRWAAGAWDYVAGVDHDGRYLILWRTDSPDSEWRRIPLPEPINDLVIVPRA